MKYYISFYPLADAEGGAFREIMIVGNANDYRTLKRIEKKAKALGARSYATYTHLRTFNLSDE